MAAPASISATKTGDTRAPSDVAALFTVVNQLVLSLRTLCARLDANAVAGAYVTNISDAGVNANAPQAITYRIP